MPLFWEVRSSLGWSFRSECKRKPGLARTEGSSSSSSTNRGNNHYSACQAFGRKAQTCMEMEDHCSRPVSSHAGSTARFYSPTARLTVFRTGSVKRKMEADAWRRRGGSCQILR
ncbi:Uncharacterized protein HZ326_27084 [Fusarium oxysporum f. sp. albedinis]|nr:Uncharacterized protein HZ326_27084 [Fusarium oxysporum f. sp. albedinis]